MTNSEVFEAVYTIENNTFNVATSDEWDAAITAIRAGGNDKNYVINITGDFSVDGYNSNTFGNTTGLQVSISRDKSVSLEVSGSILRINPSQTVTVTDVDFKGIINRRNNNLSPLIFMNGGDLTLNGSASVSGNGGSGVFVNTNGSVTMNDSSSVSNNMVYVDVLLGGEISKGGGVFVDVTGTFTMNDASIVSGNKQNAYHNSSGMSGGAGVYVFAGTFYFTGGTIYGTLYGTADDNSNTSVAGNGDALCKTAGTAQYGVFNGDTFTSNGDLATTDRTIKVVNGVLQN